MKIHTYRKRLLALAASLAMGAEMTRAGIPAENFVDLSLEELLRVEVSSVSKKTQQLADVAAAVFVINEQDIRRSGARSLPEALRLAPGVDAARISGDRWAVSIRGFNGQFANKLLVMIDGRSVYSPAFSGVFWESINLPLSEVERIEVIRGPGAAVWGANAVNGVINVITKHAGDTQGGQVEVVAGTREYRSGMARYGGQMDADTDYRFYVTGSSRDPHKDQSGADASDDAHAYRAGIRLDRRGAGDWTWIAETYRAVSDDIGTFASFTAGPPSFTFTQPAGIKEDGFDILGKGVYRLDGGSELQFQGSWSYNDATITGMGRDKRHVLDLDAQHHLAKQGNHDLIWGLGLRVTQDEMEGGVLSNGDITTRLTPTEDTLAIYSLYGQDEIRLADGLSLTLGARIEHHDYTGLEIQPNARVLWKIAPEQSVWASASRAVRTPSRGERSFTYNNAYLPTAPFPTLIQTVGTSSYDSEILHSLEIGHRAQWSPKLSTDAVVFAHHYDNLLSSPMGMTDLSTIPLGYVTQPLYLGNTQALTVRGLELSTDWRPREDWRLQASYTFTDANHDGNGGNTWYKGVMPKHVLNLRSGHNLSRNLDLDLILRHVGERKDPIALYPRNVKAYTALDVRLGWRPDRDLELSLVARELLAGKHVEFINDIIQYRPIQIEPSLELGLRWDF